MQTACKISPAAPFEKCSLLSSPVLCHSSLWAMVCKMERQLHDLVLLIKASTLTVYLRPTLVLLCIYNSLDYIVKGNTQIWKNLYQKIQTGKTTKKLALPGLVVVTLIAETTGSLQNIWDLLKPMHSICSQPISSDVQNAAVFCYYTTQNHMKHTLFHRFINKMSTPKETQVCYGSEFQQGAPQVHKLIFASFSRIAGGERKKKISWKTQQEVSFWLFYIHFKKYLQSSTILKLHLP